MGDEIRVTVCRYPDRANLVLRYVDPMSGQQKTKSAGTADEAKHFETGLRREVPAGHVLFERVVRAAFTGGDHPDDVAFHVDGVGLCIVHLTWRTETDPHWPYTRFVDALPESDDD